jgi:2-succinyl-5-enolpyruvyl-6-hydroxy-3-cyclohexene-1-carboxylate synthase
VELAEYAARMRMPVLADPLSGARRGPAAVAHYDLLLRSPEFIDRHRPDFVLRLGDLPTSKPLRTWLSELNDVPQVALDPDRTWQDPDSVVAVRLESALPQPEELLVEDGWLESWIGADRRASATIDDVLGDELSEPLVARRLPAWLGPEEPLFVASSMPVRDLETFAAPRGDGPRILANRGANGIDGTVSTAFGVAAGVRRPTVLLIGDVALAHDIGGLLTNRRHQLPLTIVLLNNDGGGIFEFLPVAGQADAFEEHIATPHGLDFRLAAELYGCGYACPGSLEELEAAVSASLRQRHTTIIEVRSDRQANLSLHRRIAGAVTGSPR